MARGKKKESALTPEEKLAQVLVPDWEQPYKVPKNWIWSYIRSGYEVTSSKRVHKNDWISEGIPFYRTRELVKLSEHGYVDNELFISEEQYEEYKTAYGVPQIGDLLISGVGTIGVPYIVDSEEKFYFKDGNIIWFKNKDLFLPKYIYFLYKSLFMYNQIHKMSSGITVDTYTIINANNTMVPVPPLSEQQRIVDRIEYLFSKLDEAKEKAQSVLDSVETRKAAILHKAFTGELTAKWRELNGVDKNSRITTNVGDIVKLLSGQDFKPEAYNSNGDGIPYITGASNFDNNHVVINRWTPEPTVIAQRADVLLVCKGSGFGKVIIADFETAHIARQIMALRVKDGTDTSFIYYFFQSEYEYLRSNGQGLIPGISRSVVINLSIILPTFSEQLEIVRILDSLFAKEQKAKEAAEAVLEKIDLLKKSILARAFRGELGTNDPSEESAVELLKSILERPDEPKTSVKRTFIPKDLDERIKTELERKIIKLYVQQDVVSMAIDRLMTVSSKKFDVMEALRNLQQRGVLVKENDIYKLLR